MEKKKKGAGKKQKESSVGQSSTGLEENVASLLCYICPPFISIIIMILEKQNLSVKFHSWQGTILGVLFFLGYIALKLMTEILGWIAAPLGVLFSFFIAVFVLGWLLLWIVCLVKAYQGEDWKIPIIGDFAAKKAGL